jgi:hypothetical protein
LHQLVAFRFVGCVIWSRFHLQTALIRWSLADFFIGSDFACARDYWQRLWIRHNFGSGVKRTFVEDGVWPSTTARQLEPLN